MLIKMAKFAESYGFRYLTIVNSTSDLPTEVGFTVVGGISPYQGKYLDRRGQYMYCYFRGPTWSLTLEHKGDGYGRVWVLPYSITLVNGFSLDTVKAEISGIMGTTSRSYKGEALNWACREFNTDNQITEVTWHTSMPWYLSPEMAPSYRVFSGRDEEGTEQFSYCYGSQEKMFSILTDRRCGAVLDSTGTRWYLSSQTGEVAKCSDPAGEV